MVWMGNQACARGSRRGFTLLELMLVITVIAIIAAMAIPSFLKGRMAANESSAVSSLRSVVTTNNQYRLRFGTYASSLANLIGGGYMDDSLSDSQKSGYSFTYTGGTMSFTVNADPITPGASGTLYFYVDDGGVIRFSTTGSATSSSSALGN